MRVQCWRGTLQSYKYLMTHLNSPFWNGVPSFSVEEEKEKKNSFNIWQQQYFLIFQVILVFLIITFSLQLKKKSVSHQQILSFKTELNLLKIHVIEAPEIPEFWTGLTARTKY